ncbi:MAG: murein peptide amidase [Verrucomicrobiales bacterium]|nr:murein peptide amidase [Verrucomicrobiales bacterium]
MPTRTSPLPRWLRHPLTGALLLLVLTAGALLVILRPLPSVKPLMTIETIGASVEGRPLLCHFFGEGTRTVFVMASIHGSEGAGTPIAERLMRWLTEHPQPWAGCRVMVMPVANPDGLAMEQRFNARGVDLNRNFPADNRQEKERYGPAPLSEPESQALAALIQRTMPDLIIAIHQPLACVDYDGPPPAEAWANRMAKACGLKVEKLGARPGSLGAWFGETLHRPIITLELLPGPAVDPAALWNRYGPGVVDLIVNPSPVD